MKTADLSVHSASLNLAGSASRRLVVLRPQGVVLEVTLVPHQGIIFAEDTAVNAFAPYRVRVAALQLAIQALVLTSSVMGMPIACAPTSRSLRRLLMRAGWVAREDPALLVREPGVSFQRQLPSGYRPAPLTPPPGPSSGKPNLPGGFVKVGTAAYERAGVIPNVPPKPKKVPKKKPKKRKKKR